jgi:outer membrane lipoprotein-sorting protein
MPAHRAALRVTLGASRRLSTLFDERGEAMPGWWLVAFLCWCAPILAPAPTADDLAAKNAEAKGGIEKLRAVQSVRTTGRMLFNNGQLEATLVQSIKSPGSIRMDLTLQGLTATQAYDGKEGWQINPFQGRKDAERMAADEVKSLIEDAEIGGPLVDWQARGNKLEYLGTEDVDGTDAHKIRVTRKNGDVQYVFLDPDHFLEIRIESHRMVRGVQQETVTDVGNYEKIDGIYLPFSAESWPKGTSDRQQIEITKAEVNVPLDANLFRFPAAAAAR